MYIFNSKFEPSALKKWCTELCDMLSSVFCVVFKNCFSDSTVNWLQYRIINYSSC